MSTSFLNRVWQTDDPADPDKRYGEPRMWYSRSATFSDWRRRGLVGQMLCREISKKEFRQKMEKFKAVK